MSRTIEPDYSQEFMFPPVLEDWVGPSHPARFIRAFVETLDLDQAGIVWGSASLRGQPSYAASLLVKIHLYARFMGIRSFRKMEASCRDNLGMLWLAGMQAPDHNTLWSFFRSNKESLRAVFKHSVWVALRAELIGLVLHALDGTKIQAAVANTSGWHRERLEKQEALIAQAIEQLEAQLEQSHQEAGPGELGLPERLQQEQQLQSTVRKALEELDAAGQSHLHPADPDARVMKCRDKGNHTFCYNDQAVVDERSGLIVAEQATAEVNDNGHLVEMIAQARQNLGGRVETTVADGGYMSTEQFALAEQQGEAVMVNLPERFKHNPGEPFASSNFEYDAATDTVICPLGERLEYTHTRFHSKIKRHLRCYRCRCSDCSARSKCTKDCKGRKIELTENYPALQHQRNKHRDNVERAKLAKRRYIVEPAFGWIKQQLGFRRHTVFGLAGARTEWSLTAAVYNLHRLYRTWLTGSLKGLGLPTSEVQNPAMRPQNAMTT